MFTIRIKLTKEPDFWLAECPELGLMTQGMSRDDSIAMFVSMIEDLCGSDNEPFVHEVFDRGSNSIAIGFPNISQVFPFFLKCIRKVAGLSQSEVATRMGFSSKNAYAKYEQNKVTPTLLQASKLLGVMSDGVGLSLGRIG